MLDYNQTSRALETFLLQQYNKTNILSSLSEYHKILMLLLIVIIA